MCHEVAHVGVVDHTLGGIRHLIWDSGHMLDVEKSELFAQAMVIATVLLTIFTVIVL